MSASGGRFPRGLIVGATALYIAIVGIAIATVSAFGGEGAPATIVFLGAALASATVTLALLVPRLRHLRAATAAAQALARADFGERLGVPSDEIAPLAVALNAANTNVAQLVASLRQERAQLEALLNASSDATLAVDRGGGIAYMNDAARHMFTQPGSAHPRPFIEVVRDHDLNEIIVAAAQRGERSVRVVAYGPAQRWIQATAVPIEGGGTWAALAVFHDLTEVRRIDSVRRDFISNVSHELRTPLAGIRAAAETLSEGALDDRPAAEEFVGHIQRETDRLTQMVEELLELSRIESGAAPMHFAQIDVVALAQDAVRRFGQQAERAGLKLAVDAPGSPVSIIGDAEPLERALGNLIANAIKFTPQGGTVTVAVGREGAHAVLTVRDTGVGIEPEQQARVFERFYKADRGRGSGGTGLGLAIVKHIVRAHSGTVAVDSRPGRGSAFTMRLPLR